MRNAAQVIDPLMSLREHHCPILAVPIFTVTVRTGSVPEQKQVIGESGSSFGIRKKAQSS